MGNLINFPTFTIGIPIAVPLFRDANPTLHAFKLLLRVTFVLLYFRTALLVRPGFLEFSKIYK